MSDPGDKAALPLAQRVNRRGRCVRKRDARPRRARPCPHPRV